MKQFGMKLQLFLVSLLLLAAFVLGMLTVDRVNHRWDLTKHRVYSLSPQTRAILDKLKNEKVQVWAFYPREDQARENLEVFFKECRLYHRKFIYAFYDPDRFPSLAKHFEVTQFYTVVVQYQDRTERVVMPNEETFMNALLRLATPRKYSLCFTTGHGESAMNGVERNSVSQFKAALEQQNYSTQEIILSRDKVPPFCDAVVVSGPHQEFDIEEFATLKAAFKTGSSIFFLIDPMDPGEGRSFRNFLRGFGIELGDNVIVDKMSRVVGGDFLVALVSQYVLGHPITEKFNQTTFFPVSRSVQPSTDVIPGIESVPLAVSGTGSWAETNLADLEKGEAQFDASADVAGPVCLAVAAEEEAKKGGRIVVVGDSDFLTDAYLQLSGNFSLAQAMIRWLVRDDRFVSLPPRELEFKPLYLTESQRVKMLFTTVAAIPGFFLVISLALVLRRKKQV